jgi:hypothetical protein
MQETDNKRAGQPSRCLTDLGNLVDLSTVADPRWRCLRCRTNGPSRASGVSGGRDIAASGIRLTTSESRYIVTDRAMGGESWELS